ncbi:MAG: methyltransferase domain-containing protein [Hyphomonas sp.]|uniref:protein-L-isoaspartate O-methyltransferase family protein n=1 Tax=Hyphomonas sp. TaxID=87 RepID=UPI00180E39AC|nr:methyltransferase domain-containing protein [Hyphomonas sp.]MBU3919625.1 methyltransferase domain-containing protein [Alphaproteobacteria bacterium]MBA3069811.1 methyltransferase domain-containing protein [Hyphomonas sp.]MBU4062652.1 methyltransferase domain-containing protein [Alphaproteobacteria bacterium]MBU4164003.1 methyltransferase domain-containing protein [Alphaproteobacteria bacterium]MBU4567613.1 methyltransferase domain-containing protein [Alphaproteobacteria bacterium]
MAGLIADPYRAARLLLHLRQEGVTDARVLTAMETLDRAAFVDDAALAPLAFEDAVLPIPCGQVILRPAATGHLLQALALPEDGGARVLLVGFGAGYMTAVAASLAAHVYAVERYARLVTEGRSRLDRLGIGNVTVVQGDGLAGWPEQGPFDRIVLAGAAAEVPAALLAQLATDGRLAAPVVSGAGCEVVSVTADGAAQRTPFFQPVPALTEGRAAVL